MIYFSEVKQEKACGYCSCRVFTCRESPAGGYDNAKLLLFSSAFFIFMLMIVAPAGLI